MRLDCFSHFYVYVYSLSTSTLMCSRLRVVSRLLPGSLLRLPLQLRLPLHVRLRVVDFYVYVVNVYVRTFTL